MKNLLKFCMTGLFSLVLVFGSRAFAEEMMVEESTSSLPFTFSLSQSIQSAYIWHGYNFGDNGVWQGSGEISYWELTFNIWYNFDFDTSDVNEVDYTLVWNHTWPAFEEMLWTDLGIIFYDFPNTDGEATGEIYAAIGANVFLNPTISLYYDYDEVDGLYITFGISHSVEVADNAALDVYTLIGVENDYYGENGFSHWQIGASLPFSFECPLTGGEIVVAPNVDASVQLDNEFVDDEFWGGITFSYTY